MFLLLIGNVVLSTKLMIALLGTQVLYMFSSA